MNGRRIDAAIRVPGANIQPAAVGHADPGELSPAMHSGRRGRDSLAAPASLATGTGPRPGEAAQAGASYIMGHNPE